MEEMKGSDRLVGDLLNVCIKLLDSKTLPDGLLRELLRQLAGELMLEECRAMTEGIYEDA